MPSKDPNLSGRTARRQPKAQEPMTSLLSLRVGVETKLLLEKTARSRRCSLSKLLREVLEGWVAGQYPTATRAATQVSSLPGKNTIGIHCANRD